MRTAFSAFLVSLCSFALAGCLSNNPSPMPAGYTYHTEVYKAPPGPEAQDLGYEYSAAKNDEILESWRVVIKDLLDQLEEQTGVTGQGIYIEPLPRQNAFNATYDEVLRKELSARGYTLVNDPASAPHLRYEALLPPEERSRHNVSHYNGDDRPAKAPAPGHSEYELVLTVMDHTVMEEADTAQAVLAQARSVYRLPAYGYKGDQKFLKLFKPVAGRGR